MSDLFKEKWQKGEKEVGRLTGWGKGDILPYRKAKALWELRKSGHMALFAFDAASPRKRNGATGHSRTKPRRTVFSRIRCKKQQNPVQYPETIFWEPCAQKSVSLANGYWEGFCGTKIRGNVVWKKF